MTHKSKNVLMFLLGTMFFLVACQNDAMLEVVDHELMSTEIASEKTTYITQVSVDDARKVAELFKGVKNDSRSIKAIQEIKPINN